MNKYFTVFQGGTIKRILVDEDDVPNSSFKAIKRLSVLHLDSPTCTHFIVRDVIYQLCTHTWDRFADGYAYNWKVIQSQYNDNSSLDGRYSTFETKGAAIKKMIEDGFDVYINDVQFKLPKVIQNCLIF